MKDARTRVTKEFDNLIRDIQRAKIKNGTADVRDRRTFSSRRITLAMMRHDDMGIIAKDIINTKLEVE